MEEELKLKEDIAKVFLQYGVNMLGKNKPFPNEWEFSDQILALIREAGWKSPEECTQCIYDLQGIGERAKDNGYVKEIKNDTR